MKDVTLQIVELLRQELPKALLHNVNEIQTLITNKKYRAAYHIMDQLKREQLWTPSEKYLQLIEKFWWEYAN